MVLKVASVDYGSHNGEALVTREQCPKCRELGKDNSKDNLAVYNDGHKYCYACSYTESPNLRERIIKTLNPISKQSGKIRLPDDFSLNIPYQPTMWLKGFGLFAWEINANRLGWSDDLKRLIFPVYGKDGELLMWQGRSLEDDQIKYLTFGPKSDILHFIGIHRPNQHLILVEDLVSAIKVGRIAQTMPLWGSTLALKSILKLKERFSTLGIWLDPDKNVESVKMALRASQYMKVFVIHSDKDPKCYSTEVIVEYLDIAGRDVLNERDITIDK